MGEDLHRVRQDADDQVAAWEDLQARSRARVCVCVCVCVCVRERESVCVYVCIHTHVCICTHVCLCIYRCGRTRNLRNVLPTGLNALYNFEESGTAKSALLQQRASSDIAKYYDSDDFRTLQANTPCNMQRAGHNWSQHCRVRCFRTYHTPSSSNGHHPTCN